MTISDVLMILAVLLAPFLAVHIEKWLERNRENKSRKLNIFRKLMATRGKTLDSRHVEALNMIDIEFEGVDLVKNAWKAYLDHLTQMPKLSSVDGKTDEQQQAENSSYEASIAIWSTKTEDYLATLLYEMGLHLNYKFDKTHIKRSIYSPQGHVDLENDQHFLRKSLIDLLQGNIALPVQNIDEPLSAEELEEAKKAESEQKLIRELLIKFYKGELPTPVRIINNH